MASLTRPGRVASGVTAVAIAVAIVALMTSVHEAAVLFLVAYAASVSVALGMLAMIMIAHLTTATWFRPFRARADLVVASLPILAGFGVLVLVAMPALYPWIGAPAPARLYLNAPFFVGRWIIYWATWLITAYALRTARRLEAAGNLVAAAHRYRIVSCAGLVALGVTMTFAAFDWMMSLTPGWASTMYGVYWFAGGLLGALSLLALLASVESVRFGFEPVSDDDLHSLGKLLTTFVLFWLYIGFSQYIVMWSGNIPREISWYVLRTRGGWAAIAALLIFGNFVFPFLLLLFRAVKRNRRAIMVIGVGLLMLHYLDTFWVVTPGVISIRLWTIIVAIALVLLVVGVGVVATDLRASRALTRTARV